MLCEFYGKIGYHHLRSQGNGAYIMLLDWFWSATSEWVCFQGIDTGTNSKGCIWFFFFLFKGEANFFGQKHSSCPSSEWYTTIGIVSSLASGEEGVPGQGCVMRQHSLGHISLLYRHARFPQRRFCKGQLCSHLMRCCWYILMIGWRGTNPCVLQLSYRSTSKPRVSWTACVEGCISTLNIEPFFPPQAYSDISNTTPDYQRTFAINRIIGPFSFTQRSLLPFYLFYQDW